MDAKIKRKWVKALMSGEYRQGKGQLYRRGRFCCLGVLAHCNGVPTAKIAEGGNELLGSDADFNDLPTFEVSEKVQTELATLNDFGVPFEVIAGLIDEAL